MILSMIAEEKEQFNEYSQLCAIYKIQPDPIAIAKHHGRMEILQILLMEFQK